MALLDAGLLDHWVERIEASRDALARYQQRRSDLCIKVHLHQSSLFNVDRELPRGCAGLTGQQQRGGRAKIGRNLCFAFRA